MFKYDMPWKDNDQIDVPIFSTDKMPHFWLARSRYDIAVVSGQRNPETPDVKQVSHAEWLR